MSIQFIAYCAVAARALDAFLSTGRTTNLPLCQQGGKVSIHVPIHREPPQIVSATLRSLAGLERVPFEVIVIDNNTPEPELWRPVQELCDELGFLFLHVEDWPGYKAGALNLARSVTSSDVEFVAVVDADYVVQPDFLSRLIPLFADPAIALVQTPQDYRLEELSAYHHWAFAAYQHFFAVDMAAHRKMDSVIFAGTMGIIRKSVLDECGNWDEHCLTEDAEIGLRLATAGYSGVFVGTSFGKGLMPLDYLSFRKQRHRWAFGGAQIFKKYWSYVFWTSRGPRSSDLSIIRRFGFGLFLLYWFEPWLSVATAFLFWLVAMAYCMRPEFIASAIPASSAVLAISITVTRTTLFIGSLMRRSRCSLADACGASAVLGSVSWLVSCACVRALWSRSVAFQRTPKDRRNALTLAGKLGAIRGELVLSALGLGAAAAMLLAPSTWITALYCIGCVLGSAMFASPLFVLVMDHVQWIKTSARRNVASAAD